MPWSAKPRKSSATTVERLGSTGESALRSGADEAVESTSLSVGVGLFAGLNDHTADHTLKLSC